MHELEQQNNRNELADAEADLALIRKMMSEAQNSAPLDDRYLVLWGILLALLQILTTAGSLFTENGTNSLELYVWYMVLGIGIAGSIALGFLRPRGPVNLAVRLYSSVWIGFCLTMCLLFLLGVSGQQDLLFSLAIIAPAITGLAFFATASIINMSWLRWVAFGWWLIAIFVSVLDSSSVTGIIYIVAYLGLMAGPGIAMTRLGRRA
jgi:hypothetical protein